jgi:hypothetical protein
MLRKILRICLIEGLILLVLAALGFVTLEGYLRVFPRLSTFDPWGSLSSDTGNVLYRRDPETGWALKGNLRLERQRTDAAGVEFSVLFTTNEFGWVASGSPVSNRPRLLFLGDSFTTDPFVSNSDAYYSIVKDRLGVDVFAMGASGFGTLQELRLLERSYRAIRPEVIVLQFCANDFENNSAELEAKTSNRSQRFNRPYYVQGERVFLLGYASLYRLLIDRSRAFSFLDLRLSILEQRYFKQTASSDVFDRAEQITQDLLKQIRATATDTHRFATFNCFAEDSDERGLGVANAPGANDVGLTKRWERAAQASGFEAWADVARSVERSERSGAVVRMADRAHWNRLGHKIAGDVLAEHLGHLLVGEGPPATP